MGYTKTTLNFKQMNSNPYQESMIKSENNYLLNELRLPLFIEKTNMQKSFAHHKILYFLMPSKVKIDGIIYDTYGIGVIKNNIVIDYILDLSTDFESVKNLVDLCNVNEVSLIHFKDVINDFLIE